MQVQILNSFRGDDIKTFDTLTAEGAAGAGKLIGELLKSGSAVFFEKIVDGKPQTFRVAGYDEVEDKLQIIVTAADVAPPEAQPAVERKQRGRYMTRSRRQEELRMTVPGSVGGQVVSVAPVSGGVDDQEVLEEASWERLREIFDFVSQERGWHHGAPMPSAVMPTHTLILARGSPGYDNCGGRFNPLAEPSVHVCTNEMLEAEYPWPLNSWTVRQATVTPYRIGGKVKLLREPVAIKRLTMLLDTVLVRAGAVDSSTEFKAMAALREKVSDGQWNSYVLSGAFPELSKRSGVTYLIRKGLPTIALTERPNGDGKVRRRFLAALCLHPLAYFEGTFAGAQCPTDEVIGHLMMIRADEHFFWKKSGQHPIHAPQAGI